MRRRPQPNRNRGLVRAGAAVIVLAIVLVLALLALSSLTAPTATAPTPPPTPPGTVNLPKLTPSAVKGPTASGTKLTHLTVVPNASPTVAPTAAPTLAPTAKPKKKLGLGIAPGKQVLDERSPGRARWGPQITSRWVAYFSGSGNAYRGERLSVSNLGLHWVMHVADADPYVQPVWSPDHHSMLYVTVKPSSVFPGAVWTLWRYDLFGRARALTSANALQMSPLGWYRGSVIFTLARETDSSIYRLKHGNPQFVSILVPQLSTAPMLAPSGSLVAFTTPAECRRCTLSIFDLAARKTWVGPTGISDERDLAWTPNGRILVTLLDGRVASVNTSNHAISWYRRPTSLPSPWALPMSARVFAKSLVLRNDRSGLAWSVPTG